MPKNITEWPVINGRQVIAAGRTLDYEGNTALSKDQTDSFCGWQCKFLDQIRILEL